LRSFPIIFLSTYHRGFRVPGFTGSVLVLCLLVNPVFSADRAVAEFMQLFSQESEPTLADYSRVVGAGDPGEVELTIETRYCRNQGWAPKSMECILYVQHRWRSEEKVPSLFVQWARAQFHTIGSRYQILSTNVSNVGFRHRLTTVRIGTGTFVLFEPTIPHPPDGMRIGISKIDGKKLEYWLRTINPKDGPELNSLPSKDRQN
jgi:hypothetical protein